MDDIRNSLHELRRLLDRFDLKLDLACVRLSAIEERLRPMANLLDTLLAKVTSQGDLVASINAALVGITNLLKQAMGNPTKIQAAIDAIDAQRASIATAITENTGVITPDPLLQAAAAGTRVLAIEDVTGWAKGHDAILDTNPAATETGKVFSVDVAANTLTLEADLQFAHPVGETVR